MVGHKCYYKESDITETVSYTHLDVYKRQVKSITYLPKEKFIELFTEWQKQWRDFLKEKTVNRCV